MIDILKYGRKQRSTIGSWSTKLRQRHQLMLCSGHHGNMDFAWRQGVLMERFIFYQGIKETYGELRLFKHMMLVLMGLVGDQLLNHVCSWLKIMIL